MGDLPFKEDYLYKRVHQELKKIKGGNSEIRLNANFIEHVVKYLSYSNYDQFKKLQLQPVYPALKNCLGNWYSYVRCNSGEEYILISPVRIYQEGREILMMLKGSERTFIGKLKFEGNCIYCLLESNQHKNLHLVLNYGFAKTPRVFQGVFSGMSTAGDPIAGREVLIWQEEKLNALKNYRRPISEMLKSKSQEEKAIGMYFKEKRQSILKGGKASTYELDDLNREEFALG
jgi:hypothetical protein